jgi:histidyl-tRNA synthetase
VLDLLGQSGIHPPAPVLHAYAVLPSAEALPVAIPLIEALRAAGVSIVMHAAGKDSWGSMKSQFKKADASGARHALVFGAEEQARGEVAVKPLRDAATAQHNHRLADADGLALHLLNA